jgi:hypothetical protein
MRDTPLRFAVAAAVLGATGVLGVPTRSYAVQLPPAAAPSAAPGAPAPGAPAPAPAAPVGAVQLEATITTVKGVVQTRPAEDKPWVAAAVGMKVGQGADIRTGLRSAVQLTVEPDQTITLDRLGTVKVLQAFQNQGKVTTDIGMKYGRAQYDIKKTDLEHASTIRSPGSTLALRGTNIVYEDQAPWVPTAVSREGRAEFRNLRRELVAFGGTKRAVVSGDTRGPAQKALASTKVDSRSAFAGRTDSEDQLLTGLSSTGGIDAQGLQAIKELARLGGFTGDFIGVPPVPGPLEFRLDWIQTSTRIAPADVDLLVTDPQGRTATFQTPSIGTGSAIGMHFGNDPGTTGVGAENVAWGLFFPAGKYTVTAVNRAGADAQIFLTITKGQEGTPVGSFGLDPDPAIILSAGQAFTGTVDPGSPTASAARATAKVKVSRAAPAVVVGPVAARPQLPAAPPVVRGQRPVTGPLPVPAAQRGVRPAGGR